MTAASEGGIYSQYAQSNTGFHCTDQARVNDFIKILDNPGNWGVWGVSEVWGVWVLGNFPPCTLRPAPLPLSPYLFMVLPSGHLP